MFIYTINLLDLRGSRKDYYSEIKHILQNMIHTFLKKYFFVRKGCALYTTMELENFFFTGKVLAVIIYQVSVAFIQKRYFVYRNIKTIGIIVGAC